MLNVAYINLKTIKKNAVNIKSKLPAGCRFYAVVKADAYGHGAEEVANAIYGVADGYCVSLPEEGVSLRLAGIDKEIIVLAPAVKSDYKTAISYDLTLSASSEEDIEGISAAAKKLKSAAKVHIAVNTGMNRFGENLPSLWKLIAAAKKSKLISVTGVYSHFYSPEDLSAVNRQCEIFGRAVNLIKEAFPEAVAHISASGGFLQGKFYGGVRIGILLYGYYPFCGKSRIKVSVSPAMKVETRIVATGKAEKGQNLLYGDFTAKKSEKYFLVRYGYADGLPRTTVKNQLNNRCMDVTAVNFDEISDGNDLKTGKKIKKDGKFYILNKNADKIAEKYGTISYEILTSVAKRAKRVYLR